MNISKNKSQIDRRSLLKGSAWSIPIIAAAIAAPAAAASTPSGTAELRFIGANVHKGKKPGTAYLRAKLQNKGDAPAENVLVTLSIEQDGVLRSETYPVIAYLVSGQPTEHYEFHASGLDPKGGMITFMAYAVDGNGMTAIPFIDTLDAKKVE